MGQGLSAGFRDSVGKGGHLSDTGRSEVEAFDHPFASQPSSPPAPSSPDLTPPPSSPTPPPPPNQLPQPPSPHPHLPRVAPSLLLQLPLLLPAARGLGHVTLKVGGAGADAAAVLWAGLGVHPWGVGVCGELGGGALLV